MAKAKTEERRAPDQDAAVEKAFVAGTLPEADRRTQSDLLSGFLKLPVGSQLEVRENELRIKLGGVGNPQFIHAPTLGRPMIEAVRELLEQL